MSPIVVADVADLHDCDAFVFVPVTDFEVSLDVLRFIKQSSQGLVILDAHGPTTTATRHGERHHKYWIDRDLWLPYVDILKMNREETACTWYDAEYNPSELDSRRHGHDLPIDELPRLAEHCLNHGVSALYVTLDENGCVLYFRDDAGKHEGQRSAAVAAGARSTGFDAKLEAHRREWADRWKACDCVIGGDEEATRAIRFNLYHLLIAANPADPTVSIGAKALAGEGYKGHVFWDTEIFVLPFFIYTQPDTARALLRYRHEILEGARGNARDNGYAGAQFAWESADSGAETTPKWTHDGLHRIWTGEEEIHITADIVYAMDTYVRATGDIAFMSDYGAAIAIEGARFWTSRLERLLHTTLQLVADVAPDLRVTSDAKHIEIGITDKSHSMAWILADVSRHGGTAADMVIVGDEFGPLGGIEGSDAKTAIPGAVIYSVGREPNGVPAGVTHLG